MAIITRYFSTAAAGAGDGTTWADRAVLFSGGAWSTVITGFNFSGTDSLKCLIGPGTHTITVAMAAGLFANPPSAANFLFMHGCDSSGTQLTSPDEDWVSAQPAWDDTGLPVIATTTNVGTSSLANCSWRLIKFTASGRNDEVLISARCDWCVIAQSTANAGSNGCLLCHLSNCVVNMSGSTYDFAVRRVTHAMNNCRLVGVAGVSGNRRGLIQGGTTESQGPSRCTITGFGGPGFIDVRADAADYSSLVNCTIVNNSGDGISLPSMISQTGINRFLNNMVTGNGGYGLNAQSQARVLCLHNRFRDNTSGSTNGLGNYPEFDSETTDTDDATEYVDAAGGDYRIKNTAATWGRGFGAGEQAAAGGGGGEHAYAFAG